MSIEILHQAQIPPDEVEDLRSALEVLDSRVSIIEAPDEGPQNALEWALPVTVAIICAAPATKLMEGFFSAAGEDAYKAIKGAVARTFAKAKQRGLTWIKSDGAERRPPPLSLRFRNPEGELAFVFPDRLDEADAAVAMERMEAL